MKNGKAPFCLDHLSLTVSVHMFDKNSHVKSTVTNLDLGAWIGARVPQPPRGHRHEKLPAEEAVRTLSARRRSVDDRLHQAVQCCCLMQVVVIRSSPSPLLSPVVLACTLSFSCGAGSLPSKIRACLQEVGKARANGSRFSGESCG